MPYRLDPRPAQQWRRLLLSAVGIGLPWLALATIGLSLLVPAVGLYVAGHRGTVLLGLLALALLTSPLWRRWGPERISERLRVISSAYNHSYGLIGALDPQGHILDVNVPSLAIGGIDFASAQGLPLWKFPTWPADMEAPLRDAIARAAAGEFVRLQNWRGEGAERRFMDFSLTPVRGAGGEVELLIAEGRDITELRRASDERDLFYALAPGLQGIIGSDGTLHKVGAGWQALLGYAPESLLGRPISELIHPDDVEATRRAVAARMQADAIGPFINRYRGTDGQYRRIQWHTRWLPDSGELYGFGLDISELFEAQQRFRSAFEHAAIGMSLVSVDGRFLEPNPALCALLGYPREELIEKSFQDITHPDDLEADLVFVRELQAGQRDSYSMEKRYFTRAGNVVWIQLTGSKVVGADGRILYLIAQIQDISERRDAQQKLLLANRELSAAIKELRSYESEILSIHALSQLLMVCGNRAEAYAVMQRTFAGLLPGNPGFFAVLDSSGQCLRPVFGWGGDSALPAPFASEDCWAMRRGQLHVLLNPHKCLVCRHVGHAGAGSACLPLSRNGQHALLHIGGLHDEAEARRVERLIRTLGEVVQTSLSNIDLRENLSEQAIRDRLTGLYNRRRLDEQLPIEFERAQRLGKPVCLAMLDIDHFKHFNDDFGHEAGDEVLRAIGSFLNDSLRKSDLVFRFGGEEFTVLLSDADAQDARERLEQLRLGAGEISIWYRGSKLPTPTLSVGVAFSREDGGDPASLIRAADRALYRAKHCGRNCVVFAGEPGSAPACNVDADQPV